MALTTPQQNALLDLFEQCVAVRYAYLQASYHLDHLKLRHAECKRSSAALHECSERGQLIDGVLAQSVAEMSKLYGEAYGMGVPNATVDFVLYENLPPAVFQAFFEDEEVMA